jgi:phosphatidylinositol alpha-1,6-mannosyltransferase
MPNRIGVGGDFESFGIVYLEANSFGKPVIGGRSGGVPEAISDGVSGVLVDPEDLGELRSAIKRLLEDEELRLKLGSAGYTRVIEEFTWPTIVSRLRPFWVRCISG